jgi:hypothetical protein
MCRRCLRVFPTVAEIKREQRNLRKAIAEAQTVPKPERCAFCGVGPVECMDHDHKTGRFRGWVCLSCNQWLAWWEQHQHGQKRVHIERQLLRAQQLLARVQRVEKYLNPALSDCG